MLKVKVTTARYKGQIKIMPWYSPTPPTNVPSRYQLPTPNGFWDITGTRFLNSKSLQQDQRSNQGHTMTLHTYIPLAMRTPWCCTPTTYNSTKYQHLCPHGFWGTALTSFFPPPAKLPKCPSGHQGWKQYPHNPWRLQGQNDNNKRNVFFSWLGTCPTPRCC